MGGGEADSMPEMYLVSTLLMGILVIAVAFAISRSGPRATGAADGGGSGYADWSERTESKSSRIVSYAHSSSVWILGFVALAVAMIAGVILLIEGAPQVESGTLEVAFLGVGGAVLVGYLFFGSYYAVRERTGKSAVGVAIASAILGLLLLVGVVVMLLMG